MAAVCSPRAVLSAGDRRVVEDGAAGHPSPDDGNDGARVSVRWTDVVGAMVLRLSGPVAPLADALAEGLAAVVVDAPVVLDVSHAEAAAPTDVAAVLRAAAGVPLAAGRVCVVASAPGTRFGLAVFRTVGDALQAWCFAMEGYGNGWR